MVAGWPEPLVRWLVNGRPVDEESEQNSGDVIENRLSWRVVTRADLNSIFSCEATNTQLSEPRESSVVLRLNLGPLTVKLSGANERLVAGRRYELVCETAGSRPPAVITWYKGKRLLRRITEESSGTVGTVAGSGAITGGDEANVTTSRLTLVPTTEDDGKAITCRAENPNVTGLYLDTSANLKVVYPPKVSLRLGSTLNGSDIKEGDDVYFECSVKSNPSWTKLAWYHNGELVSHNLSARLILINQSLVLQKVGRQSSGLYLCQAANTEGEGNSTVFHLRVKYGPRCSEDRVRIVGATRAESIDIACQVDSDPPATVFRWKFNNSGETLEVGGERYSTNGTTSVLRYTPVSELDYGTLSCAAENSIAVQQTPCLFQVVQAGKPERVENCVYQVVSPGSVSVACEAGSDGGLPQLFILEVTSPSLPSAGLNFTAVDAPLFQVEGLEEERRYTLTVYAVNGKGRSPPWRVGSLYLGELLEGVGPSSEEERGAGDGAGTDSPGGAAVSVGAGGLALALLCCLGLLLLCRRRGGLRSATPPTEKPAPPPLYRLPSDSEEKDPDLIPAKYDPRTLSGSVQNECFLGDEKSWRPGGGGLSEFQSALEGRAQPHLEPELNGAAITERLMSSLLPESCV